MKDFGLCSPAFRYSPHPAKEAGFRAAASIRFIFDRHFFMACFGLPNHLSLQSHNQQIQ
jgi:hypothetical protein